MRLLPLVLLAASGSVLAAFPQTQRNIKLSYGQKSTTVTFTADDAITKARPLCDCTKVRFEGKVLTAEVDTSQFDQAVDKEIEVRTADGVKARLTMHFDVPAAIVLSSRSLVWRKGAPAEPLTLRITLPKGSPVTTLEEAGLNGDAFDFQTAKGRNASEYTVTVTPRSTDKCVLNRLVLKTDSSDPRYSRQIIYLQVKK